MRDVSFERFLRGLLGAAGGAGSDRGRELERMPKIVDREAKQQEIVDVALRAFAERGFRAVSVGDVAAEVGISKSALYHYFPTKDALVEAIVARLLAEEERAMMEAAETAGEGERLAAVLGALVGSVARWSAAGALIFDLLTLPRGRRELAEGIGELRGGLEGLLREAAAAGHVREDIPPERLARLVLAVVDGALLQEILGSPFDPEAFTEALLRLVERPR